MKKDVDTCEWVFVWDFLVAKTPTSMVALCIHYINKTRYNRQWLTVRILYNGTHIMSMASLVYIMELLCAASPSFAKWRLPFTIHYSLCRSETSWPLSPYRSPLSWGSSVSSVCVCEGFSKLYWKCPQYRARNWTKFPLVQSDSWPKKSTSPFQKSHLSFLIIVKQGHSSVRTSPVLSRLFVAQSIGQGQFRALQYLSSLFSKVFRAGAKTTHCHKVIMVIMTPIMISITLP